MRACVCVRAHMCVYLCVPGAVTIAMKDAFPPKAVDWSLQVSDKSVSHPRPPLAFGVCRIVTDD